MGVGAASVMRRSTPRGGAVEDLHQHHFGEGLLAHQVFDQICVAVVQAGERVRVHRLVTGVAAEEVMGFFFQELAAAGAMACSRTAVLSTLPTGERGRLT